MPVNLLTTPIQFSCRRLILLRRVRNVARNTHVQYESPITSSLKVMARVKDFWKYVKLQCQGHESKIMVQCERSWNMHVQDESHITSDLNVMAKVKTQGQKSWYLVKGPPQEIHMYNTKALSLLVWKLSLWLKFFKRRSNFKVKVTR